MVQSNIVSFFLRFIFIYEYMSGYMHMWDGIHGDQERVMDPQKLQFRELWALSVGSVNTDSLEEQ